MQKPYGMHEKKNATEFKCHYFCECLVLYNEGYYRRYYWASHADCYRCFDKINSNNSLVIKTQKNLKKL